MRRYIVGRVAQMLPVILLIVIANFVLIHVAPGDPVQIMAGDMAGKEYVAATRAKYGLDQPLPKQLVTYLRKVFTGDLGYSYDYNQPVLDVILRHLPATLLLVLTAQFLGIALGIVLGVLAARRQGSPLDNILTMAASILYSVPVFWLGLIAIIAFGVRLHWLPTSGMNTVMGPTSGWAFVLDLLRHLLLPASTLMLVWVF
ncbi:MAG: Binding-protein-dependent transport system inner rane component, partial [Firmicutes bacterium]|nr:Binding-protein-dependent transport system inner rane component [Bacillota bacterium]